MEDQLFHWTNQKLQPSFLTLEVLRKMRKSLFLPTCDLEDQGCPQFSLSPLGLHTPAGQNTQIQKGMEMSEKGLPAGSSEEPQGFSLVG